MFRIEALGLAPTLNKIYAGVHHYARSRWKEEYRGMYGALIRAAKVPKLEGLTLSVTQFYTSHKRDVDSGVVAAKFFLDALVDTGRIMDDTPDIVKSLTLSCRKGSEQKTVFVIQPVSADPYAESGPSVDEQDVRPGPSRADE